MDKQEIHYIFSIGFRCSSPDFLGRYGLREISGPFDYMFIDMETCLQNISDGFKLYLKDIVRIDKSRNIISIHYSDQEIRKELHDFYAYDKIGYMADDYANIYLLINQNFVQNVSGNLYEWDRLCLFLHHNVLDKPTYEMIERRRYILNNIYKMYADNLCLFYITKIVEANDFEQYKAYIKGLKSKYNISCYIILVICSDRLDETYCFEDGILFIVKRVNSYDIQYKNDRTDNHVNYNRELGIANEHFDFKLKKYAEIKAKFSIEVEDPLGR